jgi:hypothetical protein
MVHGREAQAHRRQRRARTRQGASRAVPDAIEIVRSRRTSDPRVDGATRMCKRIRRACPGASPAMQRTINEAALADGLSLFLSAELLLSWSFGKCLATIATTALRACYARSRARSGPRRVAGYRRGHQNRPFTDGYSFRNQRAGDQGQQYVSDSTPQDLEEVVEDLIGAAFVLAQPYLKANQRANRRSRPLPITGSIVINGIPRGAPVMPGKGRQSRRCRTWALPRR